MKTEVNEAGCELKPIEFNRAYSANSNMITCKTSTPGLSRAYNIK